MTTGAWCDYNNATNNGRTYGHLYNWYAVSDGRSLCPLGWYVPTNNEWSILVNFVESAFPLCKICTGTIVLKSSRTVDRG